MHRLSLLIMQFLLLVACNSTRMSEIQVGSDSIINLNFSLMDNTEGLDIDIFKIEGESDPHSFKLEVISKSFVKNDEISLMARTCDIKRGENSVSLRYNKNDQLTISVLVINDKYRVVTEVKNVKRNWTPDGKSVGVVLETIKVR